MSNLLRQGQGVEDIDVEPFLGYTSKTAAPQYDDVVTLRGRVRRADVLKVGPDGTAILINLTLWLDNDQEYYPRKRDRITYESVPYIVEMTKDVKDLSANLKHVKVECKDE